MWSRTAFLRHSSPGFTAPEILTALSLFGVISAVAVNNYVSFMPEIGRASCRERV